MRRADCPIASLHSRRAGILYSLKKKKNRGEGRDVLKTACETDSQRVLEPRDATPSIPTNKPLFASVISRKCPATNMHSIYLLLRVVE